MASHAYSNAMQQQSYGQFSTEAPNPYPLAPPAPNGQLVAVEEDYKANLAEPVLQVHPQQSSNGAPAGTPEVKARLRKACDACSLRKVKCDEEGPPCKACAALAIPCTFERPSRRRGPPNRHAEALKKRRLDTDTSGLSAPGSPTHAAHTLASFSQQRVLSAESICPLSLLELLVDDYFTYIHPLIPLPHEPTFREALQRREDLHNPTFLALLASMIGCLVASFPRKPREHLKAQRKENMFPNSMSLVERCCIVAIEARGPGYLDRELNIYDATTSYLQGVIGAYTFNWRKCKLYYAECVTMSKILGLFRHPDQAQSARGTGMISPLDRQNFHNVNYIDRELGFRLFWVLFVSGKSMHQLGSSFTEIFMQPPTPSLPYPPFPTEVDDIYIFSDHIQAQPPGTISQLVGFNANVRIFNSYTQLSTAELAYGIDEIFDWDRQKRLLAHSLYKAKRALDGVPQELTLRPGSRSGDLGSGLRHYPEEYNQQSPLSPFPSATTHPQYHDPVQKRSIQFEIQKANIYMSQLGTRSYLVEKYFNLNEVLTLKRERASRPSSAINSPRMNSPSRGNSSGMNSPGFIAASIDHSLPPLREAPTSHPDTLEQEMALERDDIMKDLLTVLGMISQVNMEPNGGSLINKIRQIASTLLNTPRTQKGALALRAEQYLSAFVDVLVKLESGVSRSSMNGSDHNGGAPPQTDEEVEEAEFRAWSDLREYQERFAKAGGFLSEL